MQDREINLYLSRILSGYFIFFYEYKKHKLIYPDILIKYEADIYVAEEYEKNKFNSWINDRDILYYLIDCGLWTPNGDEQLEKLNKDIEHHKVELFKNFLNPSRVKNIRKTISNLKKTYNKNQNIRHGYDYLTLDGYCQLLKSQFILIHSLFDNNNNRIFDNIATADYKYLTNISSIISDNSIDINSFKQIARSEIWRNYWSANKEKLFDNATTNWTDEQKTLVVLSKMYDSALEHPECPSDKVMEDDDAFDGWMIMQREESEKNKSKNRAEKMLQGKNLDKAQEVFIVANSQDEANDIYNLNDRVGRSIINERNNIVLNSSTDVKDDSLPDVQRNLLMESNKQFMGRTKK